MGVGDLLKRLDQRLLPPIANAFARLNRGAGRLKIIRWAAVVISLTVVLIAVYAAGRRPAPTYAPVGSTVQLGVSEGASIPLYVAGSKAKLAQLIVGSSAATTEPSYFALVSMSKYLTPAQLATALDGLNLQVTYVIMRVPSPYQTEIFQIYAPDVAPDVIREMLATAEAKQREAADDLTLESQVGDSTPTDRTMRAQYAQGAMVATLEATSYRSASLCHCVYGAVVHATPSVLGQLAARPAVRVVEPAPLRLTPDRAVFLPPLPDQDKLAEPPPSSAPQAP
jgi:hypothetical protein